jgi:hypothetical protein
MPYVASVFPLLSLLELRVPGLDGLVRLFKVLLAHLQFRGYCISTRTSGGILHTHQEVVPRFVLACYGDVVRVLCFAERLGRLVLLLDGLLACTLGLVDRLLDKQRQRFAYEGKGKDLPSLHCSRPFRRT